MRSGNSVSIFHVSQVAREKTTRDRTWARRRCPATSRRRTRCWSTTRASSASGTCRTSTRGRRSSGGTRRPRTWATRNQRRGGAGEWTSSLTICTLIFERLARWNFDVFNWLLYRVYVFINFFCTWEKKDVLWPKILSRFERLL